MFLAGLFFTAYAQVSNTEKAIIKTALKNLSKQLGSQIPLTDIQSTPIPNILEVTSDLNVFYITDDGKYLFAGSLIDTAAKDTHTSSLTEIAVRKLRMQALADLKSEDMVIYRATKGKTIGAMVVFTDIDCPYCRKMQEDIEDYTNRGIEVRYLAFPRSGPDTVSFEKAVSVWCAKDKPHTYTLAVEGKELVKNLCRKNPVMMEFELGKKMSVNGTPTIFLENGAKLGGYVDAKTIEQLINEEKKAK